ncbi:hypothetical protein Cni_G01830 [Canna indica]|uniref:Uncharacterized protein n=1 Tax=Canna indica TaxID=4628 RepID=A0AAQ3JPY1_9LILI|nr:hypothetical protein Cni_G01830 [Canna indica]
MEAQAHDHAREAPHRALLLVAGSHTWRAARRLKRTNPSTTAAHRRGQTESHHGIRGGESGQMGLCRHLPHDHLLIRPSRLLCLPLPPYRSPPLHLRHHCPWPRRHCHPREAHIALTLEAVMGVAYALGGGSVRGQDSGEVATRGVRPRQAQPLDIPRAGARRRAHALCHHEDAT